ncbi:hypothetical protein CRUP_030576 [Coryphaenoides rupestris]|nr:hypothetical protein CRUP_030576 [Coryphaenoides rupestris]
MGTTITKRLLLVNYERWRVESPEISGCLSPRSVAALLANGYHGVLPMRDHSGCRVLVYRICRWNPKDWRAIQVFRVSLMTSEIIAMETVTQQRGVKVKGIHLINEPILFRPVLGMLRPFLPDKIKQRVHMHGSDYHDSLTDFFPVSLLPPEYGGEGPGLEEACQEWTNHLLRSEQLLEQIAGHRTGDVTIGNQITVEEEEDVEEEEEEEKEEEEEEEEEEAEPPSP